MDERADRGEFYPGGREGGVPPGTSTDKVDRVNLGELGESYTLKDVRQKVNQIVRAIAPVAVCIALAVVRLMSYAATAPLEDIPNTAPVVTNEEDAVAMAAVGALGAAVSNRVEAAEGALQAEIADATNAVVQAALRAAEAESNRVESTYAKRSEIPAAPDLAPYALKSELPQDYLVESDITNFATRAWMSAQGYATEAGVSARIDAQDLAINAATNAQNAAIAATGNRVTAATNSLWQAVGSESNRIDSATNEVWQSARRADETLQREIDALRIVAADSNAVTRLVTQDGTTWQDATGTVWQVQVVTGLWTVAHSWTTTGLNWDGPWWWGAEGAGEDYYEGPGWYISSSTLTPMRMSEDLYESEIVVEWSYWDERDEQEHSITTTCSRTVQRLTNAVDRVQYRGDVAAATNAAYEAAVAEAQERITLLTEMGTVYGARRLSSWGVEDDVTASDVWRIARSATNYTDAVAAEFEDGTRTVGYANNSGHTDFAVQLYNEDASGLYNASDLMRASTNAAKAVVGPATNAVLQAALGAAASKQDALPYPTNAIPYAVIDGAPSGAPVWQVVSFDANTSLSFVTNGMAVKAVNGELFCDRTGWPDGAAMFTRITLVPGDYDIDSHIRLIGYGTWPTNNFQSVWWRSGTTIYVNILLEE